MLFVFDSMKIDVNGFFGVVEKWSITINEIWNLTEHKGRIATCDFVQFFTIEFNSKIVNNYETIEPNRKLRYAPRQNTVDNAYDNAYDIPNDVMLF